MRFDYLGSVAYTVDSGEAIAVFRPVIPLTVHGPQGTREYEALVDTGSDTCMFPESVAEDLGLCLHESVGPYVSAVGGHALPTQFCEVEEVEIEIKGPSESYRWSIQALFHHTDEEENCPLILGHTGFLEFFIATFIGDEFVVELEPNEYLPRLPESDS